MPKEKTLSSEQQRTKNDKQLASFKLWASAGSFLSMMMWFYRARGDSTYLWLSVFGNIVQFLAYRWMVSVAAGGVDIEKGAENTQDVIFLTCGIQVLSLYSTWAWILWLIVPMTAFYKIWIGYIWPWISYAPPEPTDEEKKRMAKKQKKQERAKFRSY